MHHCAANANDTSLNPPHPDPFGIGGCRRCTVRSLRFPVADPPSRPCRDGQFFLSRGLVPVGSAIKRRGHPLCRRQIVPPQTARHRSRPKTDTLCHDPAWVRCVSTCDQIARNTTEVIAIVRCITDLMPFVHGLF
jgi:hypothetical protein